MIVKLKRSPDGHIPTQGSREAAGYDLYSAEDAEIESMEIKKIHTGICIQMPIGFCGEIEDRSSMASRGLVTIGRLIDSDYRGEICVIFLNVKPYTQKIYKGDRIAQIVFKVHASVSWQETEKLDESERAERGFGSTGR